MMNVKNIGALEGRILAFGGPYSNLQASEALLREAERLKIEPHNIICTGDITAYCGNPQETSALMKASGIHIIQGNCEESLSEDGEDCQCGYDDNSACKALAIGWFELSRIQTESALKDWMGELPKRLEFSYYGQRVHVLHGSNNRINEFVFPSTSADQKLADMKKLQADIVIAGHSGIPFTQIIEGRAWHNAGVIGMPANDGTPRTWYSIIDFVDGEITFTHHPLRYDYLTTAKRMRELSLTEYAETIESGILPSLDSLAEAERIKSGIELMPEKVSFSIDTVQA